MPEKPSFPRRLQDTALLGDYHGILRMAGARALEAADVDWIEESAPLCLSRLVGALATPGWRGHRILYDPHHGTERVDETDSQPDAGHAVPDVL